jgi:hypothetical protein
MSDDDETSGDPIERVDKESDSEDEPDDGDEDALTPQLDADELPIAVAGP